MTRAEKANSVVAVVLVGLSLLYLGGAALDFLARGRWVALLLVVLCAAAAAQVGRWALERSRMPVATFGATVLGLLALVVLPAAVLDSNVAWIALCVLCGVVSALVLTAPSADDEDEDDQEQGAAGRPQARCP